MSAAGKAADRVALVTAAGSGIGRATARRFLRDGYGVVANDIDASALGALTQEVGELELVVGDAAEEEVAERLATAARERWGRIDVLVNCVGVLVVGDLESVAVEDWDRLMRTNLRSMFLCSRAVVATMREQKSGSIVNLGSVASYVGGTLGEGSTFVYAVTKAGARQLATSLASVYAAEGIRVNCVCPGAVRTNVLRSVMPDLTEEEETAIFESVGRDAAPIGRVAHPDEIAATIAFLASDEASYVTGASLVVDGGFLTL